MKRLKAVLKKIFFLPPLPTVLISVPSFIFVFVMLGKVDHGPLAYTAYLLSAYSLIITATGLEEVIRSARNGLGQLPPLQKIRGTSWGERLLGDAVFRSELSLQGGFLMNLLYTGLNLSAGIRYQSAWFVSLAAYYLLLSVMRGMLVRYVRRNPLVRDQEAELRRYRFCGVMLLLMNQALSGIVFYVVKENRGFTYPGFQIYAMALHTFYITIVSGINVIKFRKHGSPILSAAKIISLTAALVSMLSLETAMLAQFGADEPAFRQIMTSVSGSAVCVMVLAMAVFMIAQSTRRLKTRSSSSSKDHISCL